MICERPRAHRHAAPTRQNREMNTRLIISLLIAGSLAFACGPRSHSEAPTSLASALPLHHTADTPVQHRSGKDRSKLPPAKIGSRFNVAVSHSDVKLDLAVSNVGGRHAEIDFPNGQSYDFVVVDSVGREVWRWSSRRMFTQGVRNKQLGVGETTQYKETWNAPRPGKYTAIATLKSNNYPVQERVDFVTQ
jgi:Intracellular proteinase inhibitor